MQTPSCWELNTTDQAKTKENKPKHYPESSKNTTCMEVKFGHTVLESLGMPEFSAFFILLWEHIWSREQNFWVNAWTLLLINAPTILDFVCSHRRVHPGPEVEFKGQEHLVLCGLGRYSLVLVIPWSSREGGTWRPRKASNPHSSPGRGSCGSDRLPLSLVITRSLSYPSILRFFTFQTVVSSEHSGKKCQVLLGVVHWWGHKFSKTVGLEHGH